jgi:hypothetical protein
MTAVDYRTLINRDLPYVERACTSKVGFVTRGEARQVARHGRRSEGRLESYHCWNCGSWHLGHAHR